MSWGVVVWLVVAVSADIVDRYGGCKGICRAVCIVGYVELGGVLDDDGGRRTSCVVSTLSCKESVSQLQLSGCYAPFLNSVESEPALKYKVITCISLNPPPSTCTIDFYKDTNS